MTTSALFFIDFRPFMFLLHLFHFILRFWNHILTWVSVSMRLVASSYRCGRVKYFWAWKWRSSVRSWWLEKAVRGRRCLPFMVKFLALKKSWEGSVEWKDMIPCKVTFSLKLKPPESPKTRCVLWLNYLKTNLRRNEDRFSLNTRDSWGPETS